MGLFEHVLRRHEQRRHADVFSRLPWPRRDPVSQGVDGFLPPAEAAAEMGVDVDELADMVRGGLLEWREVGREVWVRPAVVSTVKVRGYGGGTSN